MAFRSSRPAWLLLALACAGVAAHGLRASLGLGGEPLADIFADWVYNGAIALAALACLLRAVLVAGGRAAWAVWAAALASWVAAELAWTTMYAGLDAPPYPSLADAFYLAFYPLAFVGLVLLLRERVRGLGPEVWIDGVLTAVAAAALGATVLSDVLVGAIDGPAAQAATNLAYPLADILMFGAVAGAFALWGWRLDWQWILIGTSFVLSAAADAAYLFKTADGTYVEGTLLDTLWPASVLLLGIAAWVRVRPRPAVDVEGRALFVVPATCGLVATGLLAWDHFHEVNHLAVALALATLVGVLIRTGFTFRENLRILDRSRRQAVTDELTGLGNRRRLLADLEAELRVRGPAGCQILLLFDLDGFKRYNDVHGHLEGDTMLARLGQALAGAAASWGTAYRLGGDEFCVLAELPRSGAEALVRVCRAALTERADGLEITASIGAALLAEGSSASDVLRLADRRLYADKLQRWLEGGGRLEDTLGGGLDDQAGSALGSAA
jgi:diguanylate cyclase (GGDEF)-like protein